MKKWNETKMKVAIARAKRSMLGRTLCRLAGDRAGGVMMEYVVLGVLVVAAVVAAVILFGDKIRTSLGIMTKTVSGDVQGAANDASTSQGDVAGKVSKAKNERTKFSNANE
jgi:Flp pilus assembly pilin Flp